MVLFPVPAADHRVWQTLFVLWMVWSEGGEGTRNVEMKERKRPCMLLGPLKKSIAFFVRIIVLLALLVRS